MQQLARFESIFAAAESLMRLEVRITRQVYNGPPEVKFIAAIKK